MSYTWFRRYFPAFSVLRSLCSGEYQFRVPQTQGLHRTSSLLCELYAQAYTQTHRTQGWGHYLQYSFDSTKYLVQNDAVAGRSARSYRREGRFQTIADSVASGDVSLFTSITGRLTLLSRLYLLTTFPVGCD